MRREWAGLIKNRQWGEFEALAKREPDQILCDTVAELERGFTEKADRKALKKVLWLLEKAGFTPSFVEEEEVAAPVVAAPLEAAFMMSADAKGDTPVIYGVEANGRMRWLTAYVNEVRGITHANDETMSVTDGEARIATLRARQTPPYLSGEIEPLYALSRFKRAVEKNRPGTVPGAVAFWRSTIEKALDLPHPSLAMKAAKTKPAERSEEILLMDATLAWRLELGATTPVLEKMYEAQQAHKDDGEEARKAATKAAGEEARSLVVTADAVADHAMRLRDLAWLMHQQGDDRSGKVLSAAEELEKKGSDSEYAKGIVDKTVVIFVEMMRERPERA